MPTPLEAAYMSYLVYFPELLRAKAIGGDEENLEGFKKDYSPEKIKEFKKFYEIFLTEAPGWRLCAIDCNFSAKEKGYEGFAFINWSRNEIVIAHRGTVLPNVDLLKGLTGAGAENIKDDIRILKGAEGEMPAVLGEALKFIRKIVDYRNDTEAYQDYKISQTGHSLGGFIAQFCAALLKAKKLIIPGIPSIDTISKYDIGLFRAEIKDTKHDCGAITFDPLGSMYVLNKFGITKRSANIVNYVIAPNILNTSNPHSGLICQVGNSPISSQPEIANVGITVDDDITQQFFSSVPTPEKAELQNTLGSHGIDIFISFLNLSTQDFLFTADVDRWPEGVTKITDYETLPVHERYKKQAASKTLPEVVVSTGVAYGASKFNICKLKHSRQNVIKYKSDQPIDHTTQSSVNYHEPVCSA